MRVAVVGAGMVGLVAALRLSERGHAVTLFERDDVPGGLASSFRPFPASEKLERFYHHIFKTDRAMVALIEEAGLADRLTWKTPVTSCFYRGKLYRLDGALSLLRFAPLSPIERLRLAVTLGGLRLCGSAAPFERFRAASALRALAGNHAYATVFEPLFRGKFAGRAEDVSLAWFWARIHDRTAALGYVRGGFAALYERLVERLRATGAEVKFGAPVSRIERRGTNWTVSGEEFERVLVTLPLPVLARLAPELPANYVDGPAAASGLSARCIVLALDRKLSDVYWINLCEPDAPFLVAVEHTNFADSTDYDGRHMIYLGNYGGPFPDVPVADVVAQFEPYLKKLNPAFSRDWIVGAWQFIAPNAQPVVAPGYGAQLLPSRTPLAGLYLANLFQVYPHDRGQNYAVELAEAVVRDMLADAPA